MSKWGKRRRATRSFLHSKAANNAFANTYAKAINPSGILTDEGRRTAFDLLNVAKSPEAYRATVAQMQREIEIVQEWLDIRDRADRAVLSAFPDGQFGDPVQVALGTTEIVNADGGGRNDLRKYSPGRVDDSDATNAACAASYRFNSRMRELEAQFEVKASELRSAFLAKLAELREGEAA